jgi:serine/threonine protein kinase
LPDGTAKILDFGIARRGASAEGAQVVGTPAYMSPEQAQGRAVDDLSDVYAVGAVLYHALSGQPPYVGQDLNELLAVVATGRHVALDRAAPSVPKRLARVVEKAMSPVPKRYTSAAALLNDLRALGDLSGAPAAAPSAAHAPAPARADMSMAFAALAIVAALAALAAVWWAGVFK